MASVEGYDQLDRNISYMNAAVYTTKAKEIFKDAGGVVRDNAIRFAPYDPKRIKGTHLRDAILVSPGPLAFPNVLVTVRYRGRKGAPHAHLVEFGTVKTSPHPYMRPAAEVSKAEVAARLARIKDIIIGAVR